MSPWFNKSNMIVATQKLHSFILISENRLVTTYYYFSAHCTSPSYFAHNQMTLNVPDDTFSPKENNGRVYTLNKKEMKLSPLTLEKYKKDLL